MVSTAAPPVAGRRSTALAVAVVWWGRIVLGVLAALAAVPRARLPHSPTVVAASAARLGMIIVTPSVVGLPCSVAAWPRDRAGRSPGAAIGLDLERSFGCDVDVEVVGPAAAETA